MPSDKPIGLEKIGPPYFEIHADGWALIIVALFALGIIGRWAIWG